MVSTIRKLLTILTILLTITPMTVEAKKSCMVLSNGNELRYAEYREDALYIGSILFEEFRLKNPVWPSYSESAGSLIFEAYANGSSGIYQSIGLNYFKKPKLLTLGRYPALSPDGSAIAYFDKNNLVITDIHSGIDYLIDGQIGVPSVWNRPLWKNNNEIFYVTKENNVFEFNRTQRSRSMLFADKLLPLTSKNGVVMFTDHDAKTLFKYKSGELSLIQKNRFLTIGPGVVWLNGSSGFLYSRQTWSKILRLSESEALFYYSFEDGSEKKLLEDYSLFGGTVIPCR